MNSERLAEFEKRHEHDAMWFAAFRKRGDIEANGFIDMAERDRAALLQEVKSLREALAWIQDIADKTYEQDEKLRSDAARQFIRISDRAAKALGAPE